MSHYCEKCGKTMLDAEFYLSKNIEKYPPDGRLNTCKKCLTMHVDNWDPQTYLWILEEIDVPYVKEQWDKLLEKYTEEGKKITGLTIIGRYLAKMKLKQWQDYRWEDTAMLEAAAVKEKITLMKRQGLTETEIQEQLATDRTPSKPPSLTSPIVAGTGEEATVVDGMLLSDEDIKILEELSDDEKTMLQIKWGSSYRPSEWIRMEQLYADMMESYDIQTAGHKDYLILICKTSLRANQLLDAGDLDSFQKMSRVYDALMKSSKFTAAQNTTDSGEDVDSIGELVAICEADQFIPKYYIDSPKDKVDRVIQDMQDYTSSLVRDELGLGNLIDNSIAALNREREAIEAAAMSGESLEAQQEEELFKEVEQLTDKDVADFLYDDEEEWD